MEKEAKHQELIRTTTLTILEDQPYQEEVLTPLIRNYSLLEFQHYPNLEGPQIASLDLDPLQIKEIDEEHIPRLRTQFGVLWANMTHEIDQGNFTDDLYKDRSKVGFLHFSTLAILEVAKRRVKAPINLVALYRAIDPIFTGKFRGVFYDLPQEEKLEIFHNAFSQAFQLVNQHGFTKIGQ